MEASYTGGTNLCRTLTKVNDPICVYDISSKDLMKVIIIKELDLVDLQKNTSN